MRLSKFGYLIGEGFRNIFTHRFMSFASITIIMACLIVMGSFTLLDVNINKIIDDIGEQNQIMAFVDEDMSAEDATAQIQAKLEAIDNVASVDFMNRSEARQNFMENYDESFMDGIDDDTFRHRFIIQLVDLSRMDETGQEISQVSGIVKVNSPTEYAEKFVSVRNVISIVSLALIAIMKMVGASNGFIRGPFVVEGLILGLVGGGLAFLAQWGLYAALEGRVTSDLGISFIEIVPFTQLWPMVLVIFIAVGIIVGAFGGIIAIRNYLKV